MAFINFSKIFKRNPKQDKSCKNCKFYQPDDWMWPSRLGAASNIDWGNDDKFAKCKHPQSRFVYISIERDTNWVDARMLGTCSRGGRRFEPNLEGLATILRQK